MPRISNYRDALSQVEPDWEDVELTDERTLELIAKFVPAAKRYRNLEELTKFLLKVGKAMARAAGTAR